MTLSEYVNSFPRSRRKSIRDWIANQLSISETYVRSMCNGTKRIPEKYALRIEKMTNRAVPRHVTAPDIYPYEEYCLNNKSGDEQ